MLSSYTEILDIARRSLWTRLSETPRTALVASLVVGSLLLLLPAQGQCGESAALTRRYAEAKDLPPLASGDEGSNLAAGARVLQERLAQTPNDQEARFGQGLLLFARAIERFGQAQYRYGLRAPRGLPIPLLRLPVPFNPSPEPLTYEIQRKVLQQLVDDLRVAERALGPVDDGSVKVVIDLNAVQLNLAGLIHPTAEEKLGNILASLRGRQEPSIISQPLEVAFDRADALWLRGYCNLLSGLLEFTLAYDWRVSFESAAALFYPRAVPQRFPGQMEVAKPNTALSLGDTGPIADLLTLVHTINWTLTEPERLKRVHAHLKEVTRLSRESWKAILAETDDDREWIPGPQQKSVALQILPVTQEVVDGWLSALDDFDAVLDGSKLIPHWRFEGGINLRKVFFEPRAFDLVLWATGIGAAPFVERGDVLKAETWGRWQRSLEGNFLFYALWFN